MKRLRAPSVLLSVLLLLGVMVACQEPELPAPVITTISPDTGPVGTEITVIGSNLGESIEQVKILFGGTPGITVAVNATRVMVKVPTLNPGAYPLGAELGGRQSKASVKFTVLEKTFPIEADPLALLTPGSLDPTFGDKGVARTQETLFVGDPNFAPGSLIQPDGRLVLVSESSSVGNGLNVSRWNSDITRDKTFGSDGITVLPIGIPNYGGYYPKIQRVSNGKFLVVLGATGYEYPEVQIWILNSEGKLDQKFGKQGTIIISGKDSGEKYFDAAQLSDGKIMVIGLNSEQTVLKKYLTTGFVDSSFGVGGKLSLPNQIGFLSKIDALTDGSLLIYGTKNYPDSSGNLVGILKIAPNGEIDQGFNLPKFRLLGPVFIRSKNYVFERNKKLFIVNEVPIYDGNKIIDWNVVISQLLSNGNWDPFFEVITKTQVSDIAVGPDNSVILFTKLPSIERYNSNGILDKQFGDQGRFTIPKNDVEKVGLTFSGFIAGNRLTAYGSLGVFVGGYFSSLSRLFAARIKY